MHSSPDAYITCTLVARFLWLNDRSTWLKTSCLSIKLLSNTIKYLNKITTDYLAPNKAVQICFDATVIKESDIATRVGLDSLEVWVNWCGQLQEGWMLYCICYRHFRPIVVSFTDILVNVYFLQRRRLLVYSQTSLSVSNCCVPHLSTFNRF